MANALIAWEVFLINGILYAECFRQISHFDTFAKNLVKILSKNGVTMWKKNGAKMLAKKREV